MYSERALINAFLYSGLSIEKARLIATDGSEAGRVYQLLSASMAFPPIATDSAELPLVACPLNFDEVIAFAANLRRAGLTPEEEKRLCSDSTLLSQIINLCDKDSDHLRMKFARLPASMLAALGRIYKAVDEGSIDYPPFDWDLAIQLTDLPSPRVIWSCYLDQIDQAVLAERAFQIEQSLSKLPFYLLAKLKETADNYELCDLAQTHDWRLATEALGSLSPDKIAICFNILERFELINASVMAPVPPLPKSLNPLSSAELRTLALYSEGLSTGQAAERLSRSDKTIETHRRRS